jgi:hypothetical protein
MVGRGSGGARHPGGVKHGGSPQDHLACRALIRSDADGLVKDFGLDIEAMKGVYDDLAMELCAQHQASITRLADVLAREEFMSKGRIAEVLCWPGVALNGFFLADD